MTNESQASTPASEPSAVEKAQAKIAELTKEVETLKASVPSLEKALEDAKSKSLPELVAAATALAQVVGDGKSPGRIESLEKTLIPNATQAHAKAVFDEKFETVKATFDPIRARIRTLLSDAMVSAAKETGVKQIVITIDGFDNEMGPAISLAPKSSVSAPSTPKSSGNGSGTTRAGKNVYVENGTSYTSREYVEQFGDKSQTGTANALATGTGLTHVADAIAKKRGATKETRE